MTWYNKYLQVYEKPFAEAPGAVIERYAITLRNYKVSVP